MDLPDDDFQGYKLVDGRAWFTVGKFAVKIALTDEGIVVDVYANGKELDDALASCWALESDIPGEDEVLYVATDR